jgi:hypothetical protein
MPSTVALRERARNEVPRIIMLRRRPRTLCRSKGEPGGVKTSRRTASMKSLVLDSLLALSQASALQLCSAGRSKAQSHCLRSGGLALRSPSPVNNPGWLAGSSSSSLGFRSREGSYVPIKRCAWRSEDISEQFQCLRSSSTAKKKS